MKYLKAYCTVAILTAFALMLADGRANSGQEKEKAPDSSVIKGIKGLRTRRQPARLASGRQDVTIVVRSDTVSPLGSSALVVTHSGPADSVLQGFLVNFKEASLEFHILAGVISHIAQMKVKIEGAILFPNIILHRHLNVGL